jgi:hypothetical protein
VRKEDRRDVGVELNEIAFGYAEIGPEQFAEIGQMNRFTSDVDFCFVPVSRYLARW